MKYYFQCPRCSYDEKFVGVSERSSGLGYGLFWPGGLFSSLVYAERARRRVQCVACGLIFVPPGLPRSPVGKFADWVLVLVALPVIPAVLFLVGNAPLDALPSVPVLDYIEQLVIAQPRVVTYLFVMWFVVITLFCLIGAAISNVAYRKKLSADYQLRPLQSGTLLPRIDAKTEPVVKDAPVLDPVPPQVF